MKLLGWMHRKLRQNGPEQLMNFSRGNSSSCFSAKASLDEQLYHVEQTYSFAQPMQQDRKCRRFSNEMKVNRMEEVSEEESSYELFHGFLAIGTLGSESLNTEPPTPTFPMASQNGTDKEAEVTENELQLINNKLEKFLEAEAKEIADESSARSSNASIITFGNKQLDDADADAEGLTCSVTCPLQKYLFGSSIEVPETAVAEKKEKASLEELFRRNDTIQKDNKEKCVSMEKQAKRCNTTHFMKKLLKTLNLTARSSATASSGKAAESVATKRKLPKVLRVFHRKVHPEGLIAEKQLAEKDKNKRVSGGHSARNKEDRGKKRSAKMANLKKEITPSELFSRRVKSNAIETNGEHWIKTDADYLVLEL